MYRLVLLALLAGCLPYELTEGDRCLAVSFERSDWLICDVDVTHQESVWACEYIGAEMTTPAPDEARRLARAGEALFGRNAWWFTADDCLSLGADGDVREVACDAELGVVCEHRGDVDVPLPELN